MKFPLSLVVLIFCATIAVSQATRVEVSPATATLKVGDTVQGVVKFTDATGAVVTNPPLSVWLPTDDLGGLIPTCVKVSTAGLITAIVPGSCGVTVLAQGATNLLIPATPITVTVLPSPLLYVDGVGNAIALQSPQLTLGPFPLVSPLNFGDKRTRVALFMTNVDLRPPQTIAVITSTLIDSSGRNQSIPVEYAEKLTSSGIWQVIVRLPDAAATGNASVTVTWDGVKSNSGVIVLK